MTASGLEKSDLGKTRFYSALNMPYPNGKIIGAERVRSFIGYGDWPITLQLPLDTLASLCKIIADWLSGPVVVLLLCPPPPLHPKLGLTNLIGNSLFNRNLNLEEQIADQLGIARKEYHGKSFEGRQRSKLLL